MRLVESKPRMIRQMHMMHEADWICLPRLKGKAKIRCSVKQPLLLHTNSDYGKFYMKIHVRKILHMMAFSQNLDFQNSARKNEFSTI